MSNKWIGFEYWDGASRDIELTTILKKSDVVTIGVSCSGPKGVLSISVFGRDSDTKKWLVYNNSRRTNQRSDILYIIEKVAKSSLLDRIGISTAETTVITDDIESIVDDTGKQLVSNDMMVGIPSGWRLSCAIKTIELKLSEGTLLHNGSMFVGACIGNLNCETVGDHRLVSKKPSGEISPLLAMFYAAAIMCTDPEPKNNIVIDIVTKLDHDNDGGYKNINDFKDDIVRSVFKLYSLSGVHITNVKIPYFDIELKRGVDGNGNPIIGRFAPDGEMIGSITIDKDSILRAWEKVENES